MEAPKTQNEEITCWALDPAIRRQDENERDRFAEEALHGVRKGEEETAAGGAEKENRGEGERGGAAQKRKGDGAAETEGSTTAAFDV